MTVSQKTPPEQEAESTISLQADIPVSAHRHFKALAAQKGMNNAEYLVHLLASYTGYAPPAASAEPAPEYRNH